MKADQEADMTPAAIAAVLDDEGIVIEPWGQLMFVAYFEADPDGPRGVGTSASYAYRALSAQVE